MYHISSITQRAEPCEADKVACRYGGDTHYATLEEATAVAEARFMSDMTLQSVTKPMTGVQEVQEVQQIVETEEPATADVIEQDNRMSALRSQVESDILVYEQNRKQEEEHLWLKLKDATGYNIQDERRESEAAEAARTLHMIPQRDMPFISQEARPAVLEAYLANPHLSDLDRYDAWKRMEELVKSGRITQEDAARFRRSANWERNVALQKISLLNRCGVAGALAEEVPVRQRVRQASTCLPLPEKVAEHLRRSNHVPYSVLAAFVSNPLCGEDTMDAVQTKMIDQAYAARSEEHVQRVIAVVDEAVDARERRDRARSALLDDAITSRSPEVLQKVSKSEDLEAMFSLLKNRNVYNRGEVRDIVEERVGKIADLHSSFDSGGNYRLRYRILFQNALND